MVIVPVFDPIDLPPAADSLAKLYFSTKLNSTVANHRPLIRQNLAKLLQGQSETPLATTDLLNCDRLPESAVASISLSHCPTASAIGLHLDHQLIGVDTEEVSRLSTGVISRVASAPEQERCPAPLLLFSAKEAAWKAINSVLDVPAISQIETSQWQAQSLDWYRYSIHCDGKAVPGVGFIKLFSDTYLSFFICDSTFG